MSKDCAENPIPHYQLIDWSRFLLVALNVDAILQESTIYSRRERLNEITDGLGLGDGYSAMVEWVKAQGGDESRLGMEALMWISHAERTLKVDELCYALAVELGSTDFNLENVPSIATLMNCCQGLIAVDKEASTLRLTHFTPQEYLSARPDIFSRPHSAMAEICLTYLDSKQVKALSTDPSPHILNTPFLSYYSLYWGVHAKRELSNYSKSRALRLLQQYNGHISAKSFLAHAKGMHFEYLATGSQFTGLHCASFFGVVEAVVALIEMESYDTNEGDFGGTPRLHGLPRMGMRE